MNQITLNLARVRQRIALAAKRYGRAADEISVLAVSKRHPPQAVADAFAAGLTDFGENYVQEGVAKREALDLPVRWHFIGRIQSNKTRLVARHFDWVHTIDSARIAARLGSQRGDAPPLQAFVQVNLSGDAARAGAVPQAVPEVARAVHDTAGLTLRGLMVLPPVETDLARQRDHFRRVAELARRCAEDGLPMDDLSMGMTGDLEAAIAEGATWVRIGTALFGPRPDGRYAGAQPSPTENP